MGGIRCSVGENGVNLHNDVNAIQVLLNERRQDSAALEAAFPALSEDSKCGSRTIGAIRAFQEVGLKWSGPSCDGRVDALGKTIRALNGNIASTALTKPAVDIGFGISEEGFGDGMCIAPPSVAAATSAAPGALSPGAPEGAYTPFRQGAYRYERDSSGKIVKNEAGEKVRERLGNSTLTVAGYGCALCTLTMAATSIGARTKHWPKALTPAALTPPKANRIINTGGGFSGGCLYMKKAAGILGMDYEEYGFTSGLQGTELNRISSHISKGLPVAANVDYKNSSKGDHWVLISKKNGNGTYEAIDPTYGKTMLLRPPKDETENERYAARTSGQRKGVLVGWPGNGGVEKNQQKYIVVRFALLSTKVDSQL